MKIRFNEMCPCGSGLKFKDCCLFSNKNKKLKEERTKCQ